MSNMNFYGQNTYDNIISDIKKEMMLFEGARSIAGQELFNHVYASLNEEELKTPLLVVKDFLTNAQQIASDDIPLSNLLEFIKKKTVNTDLNYLINLCKEEHYANLSKSGHPNPEKTIRDIETYFNQPNSIIEKAILDGIFDELQSNLLRDIKRDLNIEVKEKNVNPKEQFETLNESFISDNGFCQYVPVGIVADKADVLGDVANGHHMVILTESDILNYDVENGNFSKLDESTEIAEPYRLLMESINSLNYNPETERFTLNESWDFNLQLGFDNDGNANVRLNGKPVTDTSKLKNLLLESINYYQNYPGTVTGFHHDIYVRDADNFLRLFENASLLMKIDSLRVYRNLNESNKYIMLDVKSLRESAVPTILSVNGKESETHKTFNALFESIKEKIGLSADALKPLFENRLKFESEQINHHQTELNSLMETQKEINEHILKVRGMIKLAESGSPALEQLESRHNLLLQRLNENQSNIEIHLDALNEFKESK